MFKSLTLALALVFAIPSFADSNQLSKKLDLSKEISVKVCKYEMISFNFKNKIVASHFDQRSIESIQPGLSNNNLVFKPYEKASTILVDLGDEIGTHALQIEPVNCKTASSQLKYPKVFIIDDLYKPKRPIVTSFTSN